MNPEEVNDIARRLTQQWKSLLELRIHKKNDIYTKSFLNHLEANGQAVFQYEDQELLVNK
jgi:hypothetical protein